MMTKLHAALVAVLLSLPTSVAAQVVRIGPTEFLPRCPVDIMNKIVAVGQTWTPDADSVWDCIEVGGRMTIDRTRDTVLRVQTLLVLSGGVLEIGTKASPMPADRKVEIIIRDLPFNTTEPTQPYYDPFQWGNGLVNFGRQDRVGATKTPWVDIEDIQAGITTLTLRADVVGWRVGDELLLPDTQQPETQTTRPRKEATVKIAAIAGRTITLSKPLDFAHLTQLAPDGRVAMRPAVANLTRNIVIRSENVAGTPGHSVNIGSGASWDITANMVVGLGRTTTAVINNTTIGESGTHVGLNQIARYNDHDHLVGSSPGSQTVNNVFIAGRGKWGHVTHGTHDTLVQDNIAVGFFGSGFTTEDGYEVRNKIHHNLAAYILPEVLDFPDPSANVAAGKPGVEGSGFWFRSVMNDFQGNVGWNNVHGINFFAQQQNLRSFPSVPGGPVDTVPSLRDQPSIAIKGNTAYSNMLIGLDTWGVITPIEDAIAVNNAAVSAFVSQSTTTQLPVYLNPLLVVQPSPLEGLDAPIGIHVQTGYVPSLEVRGGYVGGHAIGIPQGGAISYVRLTGTTMQNAIDLDMHFAPTQEYTEVNVLHKPLGQHPPQYVLMPDDPVWSGAEPQPPHNIDAWMPQIGNRFTAKNWQGTGQDYRFVTDPQLTSKPVLYSDKDHLTACPDKGITVGACWTKYGLAYRGDVAQDAAFVKLPGIIGGGAAPGLATTFGLPRAVITFPTERDAAEVVNGQILLYGTMTGDPKLPGGVSDVLRYSIDGGPMEDAAQSQFQRPGERKFGVTVVSAGTHTIRTWRTTTAGATLPASLLTFSYRVGAAPPPPPPPVCVPPAVLTNGVCVTPPPPPPPPPTDMCPNIAGVQTAIPAGMALIDGQCVVLPPPPVDLCPNIAGVQTTVPVGMVLVNGQCVATPPTTVAIPNVVGMTQATAAAALTTAKLIVGAVTNQANAAPVGQVLSQAPSAGTVVALGAPVSLTLSSGPVITPPPPATTTYTFTCDAAGNCKLVKQ